jgi:hypothetical protein
MRYSITRLVAGLAATAAASWLAAVPASALEKGEFQAGLYTAPGQMFTVRSPLGPDAIVIDSFDRNAGAVTFLDLQGDLFGVICTPSFDVLAGADNDAETDLAILRNWLHDATFPLFFERQLPGAAILQEAPGTFEGGPAWIAVMQLPHGSARFRSDPATGLPMREDSYRGLVVFSRGEHTYLIMTEIEPGAPWNNFLPALSKFYYGMAFATPVEFPADPKVALVP